MGIYDPVLQAYQHGVDQRIQLASQPMTLAQSILQGYQQGFGNRMQQEHLGLQRDQLAEQMRRAQAQEAEARMWHQGQMADRFERTSQNATYNTRADWDAAKARADQYGVVLSAPRPSQSDQSVADQDEWDTRNALNNAMVMMGGASSRFGDRPEEEVAPTYGSTMAAKIAETQRKSSHDATMESLRAERNRITEDFNNGRLKGAAEQLTARAKIAELDRQIKAISAGAQVTAANARMLWAQKYQPTQVAVTGGSGAINRGSKQWQDQYRIELNNLQKNYSDMGLSSGEMSQQAAERADAVFNPNRTDVVPKDGAPPQPQPQPQPKPQPVAKTVGPQAGNEDPGIKHETLGTNPRFKKAVWAERGPNGPGWYEKRNGTPVKVE